MSETPEHYVAPKPREKQPKPDADERKVVRALDALCACHSRSEQIAVLLRMGVGQ